MAEHELVRIPAFHRLKVAAQGSIGYVSGNVPYIAFSEGKDDMKVMMGQVVPCNAEFAELWNPFSFPMHVQILRGAQVMFGGATAFAPKTVGADKLQNLGGVTLINVAAGGDAAGRRRGVGIISKRGVYNLNFAANASTSGAETLEVMILPKANWNFIGLRPAGAFANVLKMRRFDGSENDQLVSIYGSYSQAEIDTWKASVGYTSPEIKFTSHNGGFDFQVSDDVAVFLTAPETVTTKVQVIASEIGDMKSKLREV